MLHVIIGIRDGKRCSWGLMRMVIPCCISSRHRQKHVLLTIFPSTRLYSFVHVCMCNVCVLGLFWPVDVCISVQKCCSKSEVKRAGPSTHFPTPMLSTPLRLKLCTLSRCVREKQSWHIHPSIRHLPISESKYAQSADGCISHTSAWM